VKQRFFAAILGTVLISLHASALSVGDKAPDFSLTAISGPTVSLSGDQGQVRVIFFFGCG
jgi:peroxiredoxin